MDDEVLVEVDGVKIPWVHRDWTLEDLKKKFPDIIIF